MASKFAFAARDLKRGLALAKLVKPSSGDFAIRFGPTGATFYSADKRRLTLVNVAATEAPDVAPDWVSDEYFIPISKSVLFDADLDSVAFVLGENALGIQAVGGKQTRKATVKRRVDATRRTHIPTVRWGEPSLIDASQFARLLRVVGCSALVKETKTEEEMRVNQVHFHPETASASSNARFHASVAELDGMKLDVSIIGSDIPLIRSFCAKMDAMVGLYHDKHRLYVVDPQSNSVLALSKVASASAAFEPPTRDFAIEMRLSREHLIDGLDWAIAALDGTQRLSCEAEGDEMKMSNNGEIFNMSIAFALGSQFRADLPAKFMRTVADHLDSDDITLRFGHPKNPTLLEVSNADETDIRVRHYMHVMRGR